MSYIIRDALLNSNWYKGPVKAVLYAMVSHINQERWEKSGDTEVWAGYKRLMLESGYSKRVVIRCIKRLLADDVVVVISIGNGKETSHYRLYLGKLGLTYRHSKDAYDPHEGDLRGTYDPPTGDPRGSSVGATGGRAGNAGDNSNGMNGDNSPHPPEGTRTPPRVTEGNESTPSAYPGVRGEPMGIRGERTRIGGERTPVYAESVPNKEQQQTTNNQSTSKLQQVNSPSARVNGAAHQRTVSIVDRPEAELTPDEDDEGEMFEFAKKHKFWTKFTRNPKSFRKGCLESEAFLKQFKKFRKATTRVPLPAEPDEFGEVNFED
jgi:hypothetical protein